MLTTVLASRKDFCALYGSCSLFNGKSNIFVKYGNIPSIYGTLRHVFITICNIKLLKRYDHYLKKEEKQPETELLKSVVHKFIEKQLEKDSSGKSLRVNTLWFTLKNQYIKSRILKAYSSTVYARYYFNYYCELC